MKNLRNYSFTTRIVFIFMILSFLYWTYLLFIGFLLSSLVWLILSIIQYIWYYYLKKYQNQMKTRNILSVIFLSIYLICILCSGLLYFYTPAQKIPETKDVLVLGGGLKRNKIPSTVQYRLETALDYLTEHPDTNVVVSGGLNPLNRITEAQAMEEWLLQHGIEQKRIIKEEQSSNTIENLRYSNPYLSDEIVLVTSRTHLFRACMIAQKEGFTVYGIPSEVDLLLIPDALIHELISFIKMIFIH